MISMYKTVFMLYLDVMECLASGLVGQSRAL